MIFSSVATPRAHVVTAEPRSLAARGLESSPPHGEAITPHVDDPSRYTRADVARLAYAPADVPIVQGPMREPRPTPDGGVKHGYINVSGHDPHAYGRALDHLEREPEMRSILLQLQDGVGYRRNGLTGVRTPAPPVETRIDTVNGNTESYTFFDGTVDWNTTRAIHFIDAQGKTAAISPATVLGHEATHAYRFAVDPAGAQARLITPAGRDYNREERLALRQERAVARANGEGERIDYACYPAAIPKNAPIDSTRISPARRLFAKALLSCARMPDAARIRSHGKLAKMMMTFQSNGPGWNAHASEQWEALSAPSYIERLVRDKCAALLRNG